MNIIEEHRSKVRAGENTCSIEVTARPGGDQPDRLIVSIGGAGPQGQLGADGQLEVASAAAAALGSVLSETLRHHVAISEPGARRTRARPAGQGRPRVGCDPERPGEYLPEPPSRRAEGRVLEET